MGVESFGAMANEPVSFSKLCGDLTFENAWFLVKCRIYSPDNRVLEDSGVRVVLRNDQFVIETTTGDSAGFYHMQEIYRSSRISPIVATAAGTVIGNVRGISEALPEGRRIHVHMYSDSPSVSEVAHALVDRLLKRVFPTLRFEAFAHSCVEGRHILEAEL